MTAVKPSSRVNAAIVRFNEPLLVSCDGFLVALKPACNYTFPTVDRRREVSLAERFLLLAPLLGRDS